MAIKLAKKVLIVPVGLYLERVWTSIVRSGADKIYLISDSKPEYEITKAVANELGSRIERNQLRAKYLKEEANFSKTEDIYKIFVGIIEREITETPDVKIFLDATSTTLEARFTAYNLANAYGLSISYVPPVGKNSKTMIEKRYQMEKANPGGEPKEIVPALSIPRGSPLSKDEIRVLYKMDSKRYDSVNDLIEDLAKEESLSSIDDAYRKRFFRVVRDLEEKKVVKSQEWGRVKSPELTEIGKGIVEGIKMADQRLKEDGLKPLMETLYAT